MKVTDQFEQSQPAVIDSDTTAQRVMIELGVWDQMSQQGGLAGNTNMMIVDTHPTHWCLCGRIWNNPNPNENGFIVITFPKSFIPRSHVTGVMSQYLSNSTDLTVQPIFPNPLE
jgi:hypothetical protein